MMALKVKTKCGTEAEQGMGCPYQEGYIERGVVFREHVNDGYLPRTGSYLTPHENLVAWLTDMALKGRLSSNF